MGMTVRKVADPAFKAYGRAITGYDFSDLLMAMEYTPPSEDIIYVPSLPEMEALSDAEEPERGIYGQMPAQIGCCNGYNKKLNAAEYHRDSEVDIAVDDLILILGKQQDIEEDHTYDISRMETFLVSAGTAVEVYATILHYVPCHAKDEGFRCVIVLPKGTNLDMEPVNVKDLEGRFLFARNKWLIGHAEGGLPEGALIGLKGENLSVRSRTRKLRRGQINLIMHEEGIIMNSTPEVKIGIAAMSRGCFPESFSVNKRKTLMEVYKAKYDAAETYECLVCIVESKIHMVQTLEDIKKAGRNALYVYLDNFGPEIPETLLVKHFDGPKMFVAAAEEPGDNLYQGRGDACYGMPNASYNLVLYNIEACTPEYPVGDAEDCADMIHELVPIARAVAALSQLKIISFEPRPLNPLACNAPIKQPYNLGMEIEENSELDLFEVFNKHAGDEKILGTVREMEEELGASNKKPEILSKLAQYELALKDWVQEHKGYRKHVAIAGKCWPTFQTQFGFVSYYVNSRLTAQGIPVSCEVDIYGALSEYIGTVISQDTVTLPDINNTVPRDIHEIDTEGRFDYTLKDTFMGSHCGNTASGKLFFRETKYQMIMTRTPPTEVTQGTLEGDIRPDSITSYRFQSAVDNKLRAYIAQGEVLPAATRSFESIGVFAIPEMGRFYCHVLTEKNFPHHGVAVLGDYGRILFEVFKYIGVDVEEIGYNQPKSVRYRTENPFA